MPTKNNHNFISYKNFGYKKLLLLFTFFRILNKDNRKAKKSFFQISNF
jgi:hypothetical protein